MGDYAHVSGSKARYDYHFRQNPHQLSCSTRRRFLITQNPGPKEQERNADTMGFKSSLAIAQTTRFKRKLPIAWTPPATPFNNTSFLIQLQQLREQHNNHCSSPTKHLRFDQYGSMDNMITSSFAAPASPRNHPNISGTHSNQSSNIHNECSQNSECSTAGQNKGDSDPPERILPCESDQSGIEQQLSSCREDARSTVKELKIETGLEKCEGDGKLRIRHRQHFMNNMDQHAQSSGLGS